MKPPSRPEEPAVPVRNHSIRENSSNACLCSAAVNGIDAYPVQVEVDEDYGDTLIVMFSFTDRCVAYTTKPR
jgi:hypothetical protein